MNIVIARDDQTFGPYSRDQVADLLEQGELSPADLASWEGGGDWQSLNELLSSSSEPEQMDIREDGENEDDFDHEKMKQWEDVFVDDEEGFEDDEQFVDDEVAQDVDTPVDSSQSGVSYVPEVEEKQVLPPTTSTPVETSPVAPSKTPKAADESRPQARDKNASSRPNSISPRSKKIKGLNSRQTVIVVKSAGIFSKIYTTSLIILILFAIGCLIAFGGLIFSYNTFAPVLDKIGVPIDWFGVLAPEAQSSSSKPEDAPASSPSAGPSKSGGDPTETSTE
jgi:hypothetical protein